MSCRPIDARLHFGVADSWKSLDSRVVRTLRMGFGEYLAGSLAKVENLCFKGFDSFLILYFFEIDRILVCYIHKDIQVFYCLFASLFVPKYQINPFRDSFRNVELLESLAKFAQIEVRIFPSPLRKLNIMQALFVLHHTHIQPIYIKVDLWNSIEIWQQLSDIGVF